MLNFRQIRMGALGATHRAVSYFLCLLLVAASLIEFQRHTVHAAHQYDAVTSATDVVGVHHGKALLTIDIQVHDHGNSSAIDEHDTGTPREQSNHTDCGAHLCMTAITPSEMRSTRIDRQRSPQPNVEDFLESGIEDGLYRPPIALL